MRIIAGKLKGNTLLLPESKHTRPLQDRARESIFNLLSHSHKISFQFKNSNVLDLYAGTGSFGLECLSRSSENVCFIENKKEAINILEKNIEKLKQSHKAKIFFGDVFELINKQKLSVSEFNLIFCDPPFRNLNMVELIELIFNKKLLRKNGIIILHREKSTVEKIPNFFKLIDERIYGSSKIIFGKF